MKLVDSINYPEDGWLVMVRWYSDGTASMHRFPTQAEKLYRKAKLPKQSLSYNLKF